MTGPDPHYGDVREDSYSAPTCTSSGYRSWSCYCTGACLTWGERRSRCGQYGSETLPALGHSSQEGGKSYGGWVTDTPATCTSNGSQHRTVYTSNYCSRCGAGLGTSTSTEYGTIAALGHNCVTVIPLGTSGYEVPNQPGYFYTRKCSRCGGHWCVPKPGYFTQQALVHYQNPDATWTDVYEINEKYLWGTTVEWTYTPKIEYEDPVDINGTVTTYISYTSGFEKTTELWAYRKKVTLDINGEYLGQIYYDTTELCTFDVYINNTKVADDVTDYKNDQILYGSIWDVKDIKPVGGKHYYGVDVK